MLKSDPKTLVRALTPTSAAALEAAVARCVAARNYEVTIEHFLLGLLADRGSDFSRMIALQGFDPGAVQRALEQACADLRTSNSGRPVFSPLLLQLLDDALHNVTLPGERAKIRSADALRELVRSPARYLAQPLLDRLGGPAHRDPLESLSLGDLAKEARESPGGKLDLPVAPEPGPIASPADLVRLLSRRSQVREADVERVVAAWAQVLAEALAPGGPGALEWPGVGTFERTQVHVGQTRERVNPFTKETVVIHGGATFFQAQLVPSAELNRVVEPSLLDAEALADLFDVPWEAIQHARGPAEDIPHHLYLATSPEAETREGALQALEDKLYCQGDVFEATGRAVPFLVRIAAALDVEERTKIVVLLAHAGEAEPDDPAPAWWRDHRRALEEARPPMEGWARERGALAEAAQRFLRAIA